ncbi:MAG: hypothetical protein ACYDC1_17070 [Limisphaerales bacterium]
MLPAEPPERFGRQVLAVFAFALVFYVVGFWASERWRHRRGPWEITFATNQAGEAVLEIDQLHLGIEGVRLTFAGGSPSSSFQPRKIQFETPAQMEPLPFGTVKFLDTTVLPGTVTLDVYGVEIECLPRVLVVDKREVPWRSGDQHRLNAGPP